MFPETDKKIPLIAPTDDQSFNLYSEQYGEHYHCWGGAYTKAREIFLKQTGFFENPENKRILEVGFGTGLNFFVTADTFLEARMKLDYVSLEKYLLPPYLHSDLQYSRFLKNPSIVERFVEFRRSMGEDPTPGDYDFALNDDIVLRLVVGDALNAQLEPNYYHWVYLDAFSPNHNPELWTKEFFQALYDALQTGGGLSTYCVKGVVRRALAEVGFEVKKAPGIARKKEITVARKI